MINRSGIRPFRNNVLVLPKQIDEKTEAGIILGTVQQIEREQLAQTEGVVVEIGEDAFPDSTNPPKIGDVVVFTKYCGMMRKGEDELQYRLIIDDDVRAVVKGEK